MRSMTEELSCLFADLFYQNIGGLSPPSLRDTSPYGKGGMRVGLHVTPLSKERHVSGLTCGARFYIKNLPPKKAAVFFVI